MSEKSEQCVKVKVKDGQIVLSVGIDFLAATVEDVVPEFRTDDPKLLAEEVAEVLRAGEVTPLEDLFDHCINAVADHGSEAIVESDEDLYDAEDEGKIAEEPYGKP